MRRLINKLAVAGAATTIAMSLAVSSANAQAATKYPISDFLDLLGNTTSQGWFDPANNNSVVTDAFGKINSEFGLDLGTEVSGQVVVKPNGDGTQNMKVTIHTTDALCYGYNGPDVYLGETFGNVVFNGAAASVGDVNINWEFTTVEGPLSLGVQDRISTTVKCEGVLHEASGYTEGTPGMVRTTQVGLFNPESGNCPPEQDANCFPAEKVTFKSKGK
jgi:hypothetical protein